MPHDNCSGDSNGVLLIETAVPQERTLNAKESKHSWVLLPDDSEGSCLSMGGKQRVS